jgi:hypothetical protein
MLEELSLVAHHHTGQCEDNRCECGEERLKHRLRPMRGLNTDRTASVVIRRPAIIQSLRRAHTELGG